MTKEYAESFVKWAIRDAERELVSGFPLVRQIETFPAKYYISYLTRLTPSQANLACSALARRMNEPMVLHRSPRFSEYESILINNFLGRADFANETAEGIEKTPNVSPPKKTKEMRNILKAILTERLPAICGKIESKSRNDWVHSTQLRGFKIETRVDVGGLAALRYSHSIRNPDGSLLVHHLSLLQWLGATSATWWSSLRVEQVSTAVDALCLVSEHFMKEMRILFSKPCTAKIS